MKKINYLFYIPSFVCLISMFSYCSLFGQVNADIEGDALVTGKLGVGTANPLTSFHVVGQARLEGGFHRINSNQNIGTWLSLGNTSPGGKWFNILSTGVGNSEGAGKLLVLPANAVSGGPTAFSIDGSTFDVGLGTAFPTHTLHAKNTGSVSLMLEADIDNSGEADQPQLHFSQDGGLEMASFGYFDSSNFFQIRQTTALSGFQYRSNGSVFFSIMGNGKVGVGTENPAPSISNARLDVANGHIVLDNNFGVFSKKVDGTLAAGFDTDVGNQLHFYTNGTAKVTVSDDGYVGVGTSSPAWPLTVSGTAAGGPNASPNWYLLGSATNEADALAGPGSNWTYSIHANGGIYSGFGFATGSDARIKNIISVSDKKQDLEALMKIEITDYTMKDERKYGSSLNKKVIAQQVEQVYPSAVKLSRGIIPDIYQHSSIKDGWIQLNTNLTNGERVKIITSTSESVYDVIETEPTRFRVKGIADEQSVFVFGREVTDFRGVDYDAISMLHVSATQAQQEIIDQQQKRIEALEHKLEVLLNSQSARHEEKNNARPTKI